MPRTKAPRHIANAVKDRGTSKRRTKEITDQARPRGVRRSVAETATGQGGSRQDRGRARGPHPGTRGGVHADAANLDARGEYIPKGRGRPDRVENAKDLRRLSAGVSTRRAASNRGAQRPQPQQTGDRRSGQKRGAGLVKGPSRGRVGSKGVGGRTRTGRDRNSGARGRSRGGSRTRGRAPGR